MMQNGGSDLEIIEELFKSKGSLGQVLQVEPIRDRAQEVATRYFIGRLGGRRCFVKQYPGDPSRAQREHDLCSHAECRQVVRSVLQKDDMVVFEYVEGEKLSLLDSVPHVRRFLEEFARGVYEICHILNVSSLYDFHTNNVLVRADGSVTFVDFDLKKFKAQKLRVELFLEESLAKAGVSKWRRWRFRGMSLDRLPRALMDRYARGNGR